MAYENGYNIFNYGFDKIFNRYLQDQSIFIKALQIVSYFENSAEYYYNLNDLDKAIIELLGVDIATIIWRGYPVDAKMSWDATDVIDLDGYTDPGESQKINLVAEYDDEKAKTVVENFKKECISFYYAIHHFESEMYRNKRTPFGLKQISTVDSGEGIKSVRFIRNDNSYIDFLLEKDDLRYIVNVFTSISSSEENYDG